MTRMGCHNPDPGVSLLSGQWYHTEWCPVFDMPRSTGHRIVLLVAEEVLAIHHQEIHLLKTPEHMEAGLGLKLMLFF